MQRKIKLLLCMMLISIVIPGFFTKIVYSQLILEQIEKDLDELRMRWTVVQEYMPPKPRAANRMLAEITYLSPALVEKAIEYEVIKRNLDEEQKKKIVEEVDRRLGRHEVDVFYIRLCHGRYSWGDKYEQNQEEDKYIMFPQIQNYWYIQDPLTGERIYPTSYTRSLSSRVVGEATGYIKFPAKKVTEERESFSFHIQEIEFFGYVPESKDEKISITDKCFTFDLLPVQIVKKSIPYGSMSKKIKEYNSMDFGGFSAMLSLLGIICNVITLVTL